MSWVLECEFVMGLWGKLWLVSLRFGLGKSVRLVVKPKSIDGPKSTEEDGDHVNGVRAHVLLVKALRDDMLPGAAIAYRSSRGRLQVTPSPS